MSVRERAQEKALAVLGPISESFNLGAPCSDVRYSVACPKSFTRKTGPTTGLRTEPLCAACPLLAPAKWTDHGKTADQREADP